MHKFKVFGNSLYNECLRQGRYTSIWDSPLAAAPSSDFRFSAFLFCTGSETKQTDLKMFMFVSLAPEIFEQNFRYVTFKLILEISGSGFFCEIVLRWLRLEHTDDKSTLVQVMAWCRQATSHYLNQCWPKSHATWHQWAKICDSVLHTKQFLKIVKSTWPWTRTMVAQHSDQRTHNPSDLPNRTKFDCNWVS